MKRLVKILIKDMKVKEKNNKCKNQDNIFL